jgi:AcrR family transcriptional regulator
MKQGRKPNLEEIAAEALVSRATAYRYFPSVEALLLEASLHIAIPEAADLFRGSSNDPVLRLERVDKALHDTILANEDSMRMMLVHSLQRTVRADDDPEFPARQNRRTPLIEAALDPARNQFKPAALETLTKALALIIGTEAVVVFKDVLQLDDADARKVKRWAIQALVAAARKPGLRG